MPGADATPLSIRNAEKAKDNGGIVEVGFYNAQDGQKGRDGGPYLDHVERQQAEVRRAYNENREPEDLNGVLPPTVGTALVTSGYVVDNYYSNPSMKDALGVLDTIDDGTFDNDDLASPLQVLPVDLRTEAPDEVTDEPVVEAPVVSSPKVVSK